MWKEFRGFIASDNVITLVWTANYQGSFILSFGESSKEITVKSLF